MKSEQRLKQVWQGAIVLTIAAFLTKILSAAYRIPYQNLAGDIGFYIYQQVYPFYGIAFILSTYGFPVILSKLIAEQTEENDQEGIRKILLVALVFFLVVGFISFSFLYYGATYIAEFMGDVKLIPLIKIISFSFLILPINSLLRGYFQGQNNMRPTAISQVIEQAIRTFTIIILTYIFISNGYDVYQTGAGAAFGSLTGGFCAILILTAYLWKTYNKNVNKKQLPSHIKTKFIIKTLFIEGITICITSLLLILIQLVDALSLFSLLITNGMEDTSAKSAKGIYDRGQPLIQLGTVVGTSLALSLVPLISGAKARNDYGYIKEKIHLAMRVIIVVGMGASVGLAMVMKPTNIMLFENDLGTNILMVLAFSIFFTSLILTISSILQGLGHTMVPAIVVFIGVIIKWVLNYILIPPFHTMGAAVASLLAYTVMTVWLFLILKTKVKANFVSSHFLKRLCLATLTMVIVLISYFYFTNIPLVHYGDNRLLYAIQAIVGVLIGGLVFIVIILKKNIFTKDELLLLPFGEKLVVLLDNKKVGEG